MTNELVESLLAENKRNRRRTLDLGNCSLRNIPDEVFAHTWLEELSFASCWWDIEDRSCARTVCQSLNPEEPNIIKDVPPDISKLVNLRKLWLNGTEEFTSRLVSIEAIGNLENLHVLGISNSKVRNLAPLSKLKQLCFLDVGGCRSIKDITPLDGLHELKFLTICETGVKDPSPLAYLRSLEFLDACYSSIRNLKPILPMLQRGMDVYDSSPDEYVTQGIFVAGCEILIPPPEIVAGGAQSVRMYFDDAESQGVDHLYEAKMLIVGEGGAGKTSLLRRLFRPNDPMPEESETTKGISIYRHQFKLGNGRNYRLNVWDFGGQEIYHATHQFFLTRRSLYILVDDTRRDSKTVYDEGFKYWLEVVDALSGHSPILIFQNEKGGRSKAIDESGIRAAFTNVMDFFRGDLIDAKSTKGLRAAIEYQVQRLPHVGEELPAKWLLIRADVEREAKFLPYISEERYMEIYSNHLEPDRAKALQLSRYLHDLGVYLHFQEDRLLRRTIILHNQWGTEAVFLVVDDNVVKSKFGRFTEIDLLRIWSGNAYKDMHPELLALMQKFELCYRLPDSQPEEWLIPQLLPPSRPEALNNWSRTDDIVLRYRYEFMPKGIISRLMVRQHRFVKHSELGWASGALFERGDSQVLASLPAKGNEIVLHARGVDRKELLAIITSDLDALNSTFHGVADRVRKLVPCICERCRSSMEPEYFDLRKLQQRRRDRKFQIECDSSYLLVNVNELIDGTFAESKPDSSARSKRTANKALGRSRAPLTVFLASSLSLRDQRDAVDLYLRQLPTSLAKGARPIQVVRAENFDQSMSIQGAQARLNSAIIESDVFICIISGSIGKFTEEEFDIAFNCFKECGKPLVYVYFQVFTVQPSQLDEDRLQSLAKFRSKIVSLGHFVFDYDTIDRLKVMLFEQLSSRLISTASNDFLTTAGNIEEQ